MRNESHPYNYNLRARFPVMKRFKAYEGGSIMTAEQDGKYYIIVSEAAMADFLTPGEDDDLLNKLIRITEFDTEEEWKEHLAKRG